MTLRRSCLKFHTEASIQLLQYEIPDSFEKIPTFSPEFLKKFPGIPLEFL